MALQIRRGNTAERLSITPLPGEPIFDTTLNQLFVGDGVTAGGRAPTISSLVVEQAIDSVGQALVNGVHKNINFIYGDAQDNLDRIDAEIDLSDYDGEIVASAFRGSVFADDSGIIVDSSNKNITANSITAVSIDVGTINITGSLSVENVESNLKGSVFADNSTLLIDGLDGSINLDGTVKGDIIPDGDELYDIGSPTNKFRDLYLSGSSLNLGSAQITAVGSAIELPAGSTVNGIPIGTGSGTGDGVIEGSTYKINIAADDSTVIVDTDSQTVTAQGGFFGDISSNVISTQFIDGASSSEISVRTALRIQSDLIIENELILENDLFLSPQAVASINVASINSIENIFLKTDSIDSNNADKIDILTRLEIFNQDPSNSTLTLDVFDNSALSNRLAFRRARGTRSSPEILQPGDVISRIDSQGYDGNRFVGTLIITNVVTALPSTDIVPTRSVFNKRTTSGVLVESLIINDNGSLETSQPILIRTESSLSNPLRVLSSHSTTDNSSNVILGRSRGTSVNPTTLTQDDVILDLIFSGHDGIAYRQSSMIRGVVDGPVSSNIVPGKIEFHTVNLLGNFSSRMVLKNDGTLQVDRIQSLNSGLNIEGDLTGSVFADGSTMIIDGTEGGKITTPSVTIFEFLQLSVFADDTARNSAITSPSLGMVIFMQSGISPAATNQPQYFNGSAWVSI
jgi:hypothetical protein